MPKFSEALDRDAESIKRPPPPPLGHYLARVSKVPSGDPRELEGKDGTSYEVTGFTLELLEPQDDVDEDELAAFGKVQGTFVPHDFMFNVDDENKFEGTLNRMKTFLIDHCGVDPSTLKQMIADAQNMQVIAQIGHRPDKNDPDSVFPEVKSTTAA